MRKRFFALALMLAVLAAIFPAAAASDAPVGSFTALTGREMLPKILLGINIGNTLEAREDGRGGLETETLFGEAAIEPWHFKAIAQKGYTAVRIPVSWEPHMDKDYNIDHAWMERVETCVQWAMDAGLYVILNAHHESGLYRLIDNDNYTEAKRQLTFLWEQVAARFKDYSEKLIFEVMNEPYRIVKGGWIWANGQVDQRLCAAVNRLNTDALAAIRASGGYNGKRVVALTVPGANVAAVPYYQAPDDPYTMLGVFVYAGESVETIREAVGKGVAVYVKETAAVEGGNTFLPPNGGKAAWVTDVFGRLFRLGVPVFWWNHNGYDGLTVFDRSTGEWTDPALVRAAFEAYGQKPGPDYLPTVLLPYELDGPYEQAGYTYWRPPGTVLAKAEKMVVEISGSLSGWYSFTRSDPSPWAQFDRGHARVTAESGRLTFDMRGLSGGKLGFAVSDASDALKIKRVYLDTWADSKIEAPNLGTATAWAHGNLNKAFALGLIPASLQSGYAGNCSRAEFCALAVALIETATGRPVTVRKAFNDDGGDVNIRKIGGLGIISGTGNGDFEPYRSINRQDAAIILARVAEFGLKKPLPEGEADFSDIHLSYAEQYIRQMRGGNIMSGRPGNIFDPGGLITREESVTTMLKLWEWYSGPQ